MKKLFIGRPLIIIEKGKINYGNLKKSKLNIDELISQCRILGYFDLAEIYYCIFEPNGQFSIMPIIGAASPKLEDLKILKQQQQLAIPLVIDGKIVLKMLGKINKDREWLFKELNAHTKRELKNILLAQYDQVTSKLEIIYKKSSESQASTNTLKTKK